MDGDDDDGDGDVHHRSHQLSRKKSHEIFRHGDDIAKVRFYNASVYAQQQEVSTHKQTQQHQNCLNADLINPLAQINTA